MELALLFLALFCPDSKFFKLHPATRSDYTLTIFVDARHLDYSNGEAFLSTLAKHPSDWSKNGDVGHAWITLKGPDRSVTGGQTGERERPTYTQGVLQGLITENPIAYLQTSRTDGAFEKGSGGHIPTFAAQFNLTSSQFEKAYQAIRTYPFHHYSLTTAQCTSFATFIARSAGIELEDTVILTFPQTLRLGKTTFLLWRDPSYAKLALPTPDRLERSLQEKVLKGEAQYALSQYKQEPLPSWFSHFFESIERAPARFWRWFSL